MAVTNDGNYYKARFDPVVGKDCVIEENIKIFDIG